MFRGHYIDVLESELYDRTDNWKVDNVPIPLGHHLMGRAWWSRRVNIGIWLMFFALAILYFGIIWESFTLSFYGIHHGTNRVHRAPVFAILDLIGVGIATSIVFSLYLAINRPTNYFKRLVSVVFGDKRAKNKLYRLLGLFELGWQLARLAAAGVSEQLRGSVTSWRRR